MDGVCRREAHFRVFAGTEDGVQERRRPLCDVAGMFQGTVIIKFDTVTHETELWLAVSESEAIDVERELKHRGLWPKGDD